MKKSLLLSFTLFLFSCDDTTTDTKNLSVILPLQVSNYWVYKVTSWSTKANTDTVTSSDTIKVLAVQSFQNESWYLVSTNFGVDTVKRQNRSDGLWEFYGLLNPHLIAKYPAKVGDMYDSITVASVDTTIKVFSGSFSCYMYKYSSSNSQLQMYYSPNVGLIKQMIYSVTSNIDGYYLQRELLSYKIN